MKILLWIASKWYRTLIFLIIMMALKTFCEVKAWGSGAPVIPPPAVIPPVVLMFQGGQEPQIFRMPNFSYLGCSPLRKEDKIIKAIHFTATGKNLFEKVIEYHEKVYLQTKHDPAKMRMLVTVKSINN
jgi:hypothetical protein